MKNNFILVLTFVFFLFNSKTNAQNCYTGDITFSSQLQIDNFFNNGYDCITGNVNITEGSLGNIVNLTGLENVTSIDGYLFVESNSALTSFSGLNNLTSIGGFFFILNNTALTSLSGLENVTSIGGYLQVENGSALTSLSGLDNLMSIGGDFDLRNNNVLTNLGGVENLASIGGYLTIGNNSGLTSFSGLDNLASIGGYLSISNNSGLTSLSGLGNLTSIGEFLDVRDNHALTSLSGLGNLTSIGNQLSLVNNSALTSLSGLGNLASIGGFLYVESNPALTSLSGLDNLTSIGGYLYVLYNAALTSLSGLDNLTSIGEYFQVESNSALINLNGLGNLTSVDGDFDVRDNTALTNLSGLDNLTSIDKYLVIVNNSALTSLSGLGNLTSIGNQLSLVNNSALTSLSGLGNLASIGGFLEVRGNSSLTSLSGLDNLVSIGEYLQLENNGNLSACELMCEYLSDPNNPATILNNATGCNSREEVEISCDACPNDPENDIDGDGICGDVDNCPHDSNIDQANIDGDEWGDACDDVVNVGGAGAILIEDVESLGLPNGLENALRVKIENAMTACANGNETAAVNMLSAFINQVNALRGNPLTNEQADALIENAQQIIDAIENGEADCGDDPPAMVSNSSQFVEAQGQHINILQLEIAPNPFDQSTMINFTLPEDQKVSLIIYNMNGKLIKVLVNEMKDSGNHQIEWDARNELGELVTVGVYYFHIKCGTFIETQSLIRVH